MAQEIPIQLGGTGASDAATARANLGTIGTDSIPLENIIKVNQNWNVDGEDATLTSTPQTIADGDEFTFGWSANGSSIVNIARSSSGITTATSGVARYTYPMDLNGLIDSTTVKFYVDDGAGNQTLATGSNGLTVSDDGTNVYLDIDFSTYTDGVGFVGISTLEGVVIPINESSSSLELWPLGVNQVWNDVTASRTFGLTYTNTTGRPMMVSVTAFTAGGSSLSQMSISVNGVKIQINSQNGGTGAGNVPISVCVIVQPGSTYILNNDSLMGALERWFELF